MLLGGVGRTASSNAELFKHGSLLLGLDCSTQSLTVSLYSTDLLTLVDSVHLDFDSTFPEFKTSNGVHISETVPGEVTAPSLLFVAALDRALSILSASDKCDLSQVVALSGSGQQHGSVYWRKGAFDRFRRWDNHVPQLPPGTAEENKFPIRTTSTASSNTKEEMLPSLSELMVDAFTFENGPVWMDASTTDSCRQLESLCGGAAALAAVTGASCYERFSGVQILKRLEQCPEAMAATERVSLVSSLIASLFVGTFAAVDASDACGMGLVDIRTRSWGLPIPCAHFPSPPAPRGAQSGEGGAERLLALLGGGEGIVDSHSVIGCIHPYLQRRFGFSPDCLVVAFSGDNPCSLAGMQVTQPGSACISLGTSSTVFAIMPSGQGKPSADEGWVFLSPLSPSQEVCMAVFKNGALLRERVKRQCCGDKASWADFNSVLELTPPGNNGNVGFFFDVAEITPRCRAGVFRFDPDDCPVADAFDNAVELRAAVEFQLISLRLHSVRMGVAHVDKLYLTGGASSNVTLIQALSDVFGAPVYTARGEDSGDGATRGAALRAMHGAVCHYKGCFVKFEESTASVASPFYEHCSPNMANFDVYTHMTERFSRLEELLPSL